MFLYTFLSPQPIFQPSSYLLYSLENLVFICKNQVLACKSQVLYARARSYMHKLGFVMQKPGFIMQKLGSSCKSWVLHSCLAIFQPRQWFIDPFVVIYPYLSRNTSLFFNVFCANCAGPEDVLLCSGHVSGLSTLWWLSILI